MHLSKYIDRSKINFQLIFHNYSSKGCSCTICRFQSIATTYSYTTFCFTFWQIPMKRALKIFIQSSLLNLQRLIKQLEQGIAWKHYQNTPTFYEMTEIARTSQTTTEMLKRVLQMFILSSLSIRMGPSRKWSRMPLVLF